MIRRRRRNVWFRGTCSNCRRKQIPVRKWKSAQICRLCLTGSDESLGDPMKLSGFIGPKFPGMK